MKKPGSLEMKSEKISVKKGTSNDKKFFYYLWAALWWIYAHSLGLVVSGVGKFSRGRWTFAIGREKTNFGSVGVLHFLFVTVPIAMIRFCSKCFR